MSTNEVLKLALRSLKELVPDDSDHAPAIQGQRKRQENALKALQEALAEPPAPVQGWKLVPVEPTPEMRKAAVDAWLDCGSKMTLNKASAAVKAGIDAAPQTAQPQQEPVAWVNPNDLQNFDMKVRTNAGPLHTVPLYTSPPARKPLTEGELSWLWSDAHNDTTDRMAFQVFARAIEAAHGIEEKNT